MPDHQTGDSTMDTPAAGSGPLPRSPAHACHHLLVVTGPSVPRLQRVTQLPDVMEYSEAQRHEDAAMLKACLQARTSCNSKRLGCRMWNSLCGQMNGLCIQGDLSPQDTDCNFNTGRIELCYTMLKMTIWHVANSFGHQRFWQGSIDDIGPHKPHASYTS
eukprot:1159924-Pelagomonas_calceolata.AAC.6